MPRTCYARHWIFPASHNGQSLLVQITSSSITLVCRRIVQIRVLSDSVGVFEMTPVAAICCQKSTTWEFWATWAQRRLLKPVSTGHRVLALAHHYVGTSLLWLTHRGETQVFSMQQGCRCACNCTGWTWWFLSKRMVVLRLHERFL